VAKASGRTSSRKKAVKDLAPNAAAKGDQEVMGGTSNVSKTRTEISMTFARNARA
jgi:hypothetical protein